MTVYVVEGGDYENFGWYGVFSSREKALAAFPLPEMRAIPGQQCDPTFDLQRPSGWQPDPDDPSRWWNGFSGDFGNTIVEVTVDER